MRSWGQKCAFRGATLFAATITGFGNEIKDGYEDDCGYRCS